MSPEASASEWESEATKEIRFLYDTYGQRKAMGQAASSPKLPHYFLQRCFLEDNDLLVILNTKRCRYRCPFCNLPAKSSQTMIAAADIIDQFLYVCREVRHSLSVIDRVTLSNEGSVLDEDTLPKEALRVIISCISEIRSARCVVLETRLEFVRPDEVKQLTAGLHRLHTDILTGFETRDGTIREHVLAKGESIQEFEAGLDAVRAAGCSLTAFVLFKPDPRMTDRDAVAEADRSIKYLQRECTAREISLTIRLNPMYRAAGTPWEKLALTKGGFLPPRLTDVLDVAERARQSGLRIYVGLSSEGLAGTDGTYMAREDFSRELLRRAVRFNTPGGSV